MDRNILLTYTNKENKLTYGWFEDEEELKDFVNSTDDIVEINDCLDCSNCREIEIEVSK
jgi:hypothetical protein